MLTRGEGYGTNRLGGYDAGDVTSRQQREGEEKSVSGLHRVFVEVVASREKKDTAAGKTRGPSEKSIKECASKLGAMRGSLCYVYE